MKDKMFEALFGEGGLLRVRAVLAIGLTATCAVLWLDERTVPDALLATTAAADAYYFAARQAA
jgi:hypothetical protein